MRMFCSIVISLIVMNQTTNAFIAYDGEVEGDKQEFVIIRFKIGNNTPDKEPLAPSIGTTTSSSTQGFSEDKNRSDERAHIDSLHQANLPNKVYNFLSLLGTYPEFICLHLDIRSLGRLAQVCRAAREIFEKDEIWQQIGYKFYGDYLSPLCLQASPRNKVVKHFLRVLINSHEGNVDEIREIIQKYQLNSFPASYIKHLIQPSLLRHILDYTKPPQWTELIYQGNINFYDIEPYLDEFAYNDEDAKEGPPTARELHEIFIRMGNLRAIEKKRKGLMSGNDLWGHECYRSGYKRNDEEAISFLSDLRDQKYSKALKWKAIGYLPNGIELNEELIEAGNCEAILRKIIGFFLGAWRYEKDHDALRQFITALTAKGYPLAFDLDKVKSEDMDNIYGNYGDKRYDPFWKDPCFYKDLAYLIEDEKPFTVNSEHLKELIEYCAGKGDSAALKRQIQGLLWGKSGFERNNFAGQLLLHSLIVRKNPMALKFYRKHTWAPEWFDNNDKPTPFVKLIERRIDRGNIKAMLTKIAHFSTYLENDADQYSKEEELAKRCARNEEAKRLNEDLILRGNPEAVSNKYYGLQNGYCYEKNEEEAERFFNEWLEKENPWAVLEKIRKLMSLAKDERANNNKELNNLLEKLEKSQIPQSRGIARYFKAIGIKYGIFGYQENLRKAIKYIQKHHIPY